MKDTKLKDLIDYAWLNLDEEILKKPLKNRFLEERSEYDIEHPLSELLNIITDPKNFYFTVKNVFGIELLPFQLCVLDELWHRKYPMLIASRGASKSFMLGLYALLRAILHQGCKIIIVGSGFRQAKVVFEYCERIWNNAPVLRSMCGDSNNNGPRRGTDQWTFNVGESTIIAIPIGDGTKIRGQRANYIIADEFASIPEEIYENVIAGFAAVSSDPVQQVKTRARMKTLKEQNMWTSEQQDEVDKNMGNQAILSGTAYYDFNHFSKYWKKYKTFILSKGREEKLKEIYPDGVPSSFNYKDFSIIRLPYEMLPSGFMDETHVARSKATVHTGIYQMEFGACFTTDSNGFFKRSLVESCVTTNPIIIDGQSVQFQAVLRGNSAKKYIFAIDPASEQDNFSIIILEMHDSHRRIVYSWTTTRSSYRELVKSNLIKEQDFYGFCARKIRDLMRLFPCERIVLDSQGGGVAVEEALHDTDKLQSGEQPIWRIKIEGEEQDSDDFHGLHILEVINFSNAEWVRQANHGLRKDLEDKVLLFPYYDSTCIGFAAEEDRKQNRLYDTLEDCVFEIEELKDELATIVHTQTGTAMRDHWDTPEVKMPGGKKGRLRKDRYSALLMANMSARVLQRAPAPIEYNCVGGFASSIGKANGRQGRGPMYEGAAWYDIPSTLYKSVRKK